MFILLFNTVFNLKINLKQKIDPKMCMFKNLEEILKLGKILEYSIKFHLKS